MVAAPAVRTRSTSSRPAAKGLHAAFDRIGVVLHVPDRTDLRAETLDLGPDAGLEPVARDPVDGLLDDDPTVERTNGATHTTGVLPKPGDARTLLDDRARHDMWRDLDAGHQIPGRDDLAVERGEDLERIDPVDLLEVADVDVEDAGHVAMRSTRLCVGPRRVETAARDGVGQPDGGIVLVHLPRLEHDHRDRVGEVGVRQPRQVVAGQAPTLGPPFIPEPQVARQHGTDQTAGRAPAGCDLFDAHRSPFARSGQAAEGSLDRAARVDRRHRSPIRGVGVDIGVDGDPVRRVGGGRRDRRRRRRRSRPVPPPRPVPDRRCRRHR